MRREPLADPCPEGWENETTGKVLDGDADAYGEIIRAYRSRLRSYCRARLPESEIDDAMQDVFLKAFRSLRTYNSSWPFSTWFFTIAHSVIAGKKYRFKRERETLRRIHALREERTYENEGQKKLEADMVHVLVSGLCKANRQVVELYYFAQLGVSGISRVLSISESAVKTRLFRARKELLALMEREVTSDGKRRYTES